MVRLNRTYYSLLNFTSKNFFKIWSFGQNSNKLSKIRSNRLYTPRIAQNSHRLLTYLYYVSGTCPGREPCGIPANYANSAQFAHSSANYAKFAHFVNLFYIMFQAPALAENSQEFQQITQIPRNSPTQSANHVKFTPFANIIHYVSDA